MAAIKDKRILEGKVNRNKSIRDYFKKRFNDGMRYDIIMNELIGRYGLSESTIYQIVKRNGSYAS